MYQILSYQGTTFGRAADVAGVVYNMSAGLFKSYTRHRAKFPTFSLCFENRVFCQVVFYPWSRLKGNSFFSFIFYNFHLSYVWIGKINAEILQATVRTSKQRYRNHLSMEDKLCSVSFYCQRFHILQCQTYFLGLFWSWLEM